MARRLGFALLLSSLASVAHASETPLYQPVPAWVKPAPAPDPKALGPDAPILLIADGQQKIAGGQLTRYVELAWRVPSEQALAQLGTVKFNWQPSHGDLIVHRIDILRGDQRIDVLKSGARPAVLRREQQLEQLQITGMLTAVLPVDGLRIGDVLDIAYSVTNKDPTLKGNVDGGLPLLAEPNKVGFTRARLIWPQGKDLRWKAYPVGAQPQVSDSDGWHEVLIAGPVPKQPDPADRAPRRFNRPLAIAASTFRDWGEVAAVMAPLYQTGGLIAPGSPLAGEVARIAAATPDPRRRVALALELVQGQIRYLASGLDNGNLVPQAPAKTWEVRYGDCKAKTLLLLAILRDLKIEAEPALATLNGGGDGVSERLPGIGAFNHILVLATVDGKQLWLDGTGLGTHFEDLDDVPPLGWVLPVRASGATLLAAPDRAPGRPNRILAIDMDMSGGVALPAPAHLSATFRGAIVPALRTTFAQADKEARAREIDRLLGAVGSLAVSDRKVSFDDQAGTVTLEAEALMVPRWQHQEQRYRFEPPVAQPFAVPNRARAIWRDVPVETGAPTMTLVTQRLRLPAGTAFTLEGDQKLDLTMLGGRRIERKVALAGDLLTIEERTATSGAEIAAADLPQLRLQNAALARGALRVSSPSGYPGPWPAIEAAKRARKFDRALAILASAVAEKPDDARRWLAKARFEEAIFERPAALADLDKAVQLDASAPAYLQRAAVHVALGHSALAVADLKAARALDPGSRPTLTRLALYQADHGAKDEALQDIQAKIDEGGKDKADYLMLKAEILARTGATEDALAAADEAVEISPNSAALLNGRCWVRGLLNSGLELAVKDCTKAIELSDANASALDSRGLLFFRMGRWSDALADFNAALDLRPGSSASLYMRGITRKRSGDAESGAVDIASALRIAPVIGEEYARFGIKP